MRNFSRQYALLVGLFLVLMTGFIAIVIMGYITSRDALKTSISEQRLPAASAHIHSQIQKDILRPVLVSARMAQDTFVRDWITAGEQDSSQIFRYLKENKLRNNAISSFLISDLSHHFYQAEGTLRTISETNLRDQWFFKMAKLATPYDISASPDLSRQTSPSILIRHRIVDDSGKFIGIAGISVALDNLKRSLDNAQSRFHARLYFVDAKGQVVLAGSGTQLPGNNIFSADGIGSIAAQLVAGKETAATPFHYERDKDTVLISTSFIPELGWHLLAEQGMGAELTALQETLMVNSGIGVTTIILALLLVSLATRRYQQRIEKTAATDQLTRLLNRQAFDFVFENALLDSERSRQPLCVALVDIDFFKKLNDKHGRLVGNHILKEIAMIIKRSLRESDVICRWGGEEFLFLLKNCTLEKATSIAENLRNTIAGNDFSRTTDLARKKLSITVSMGVAQCKDKETEDSVFERAEVALHQAKENGRDSVYFTE